MATGTPAMEDTVCAVIAGADNWEDGDRAISVEKFVPGEAETHAHPPPLLTIFSVSPVGGGLDIPRISGCYRWRSCHGYRSLPG